MNQVPSEFYMRMAIQEALRAFDENEVPVGAVIEKDGRIIGRGYNRMEGCGDATAHAEIVAIGAASSAINDWRLDECTIYVTLEPCLMCLGAIMQSRISTIVYACADPRLGAVDTNDYRDGITRSYNRFPHVVSGILMEESAELLKSFFRTLRKKNPGTLGTDDRH